MKKVTKKQFLIREFKEKWAEDGGRYHGFLKSLCHIDDVVELINKCIKAEKLESK